MNCNSCNAAIPVGGKFCPECGATASFTASCSHCGEQNPPNSTFCAGCGKSLKAQATAALPGTQDYASDFVYLLSEEKMRAVSTSSVRIPYGCFAVTLVNGAVHEILDQVTAGNSEPSAIAAFFKSVSEFARGLVGQKNNDVKTYIVSNCQGLPLISYVHPVKLPSVSNANLRFDFWLENTGGEAGSAGAPIGLFLQRVLSGKNRLSTSEFRQAAISSIQSALSSQANLDVESQEALDSIMVLLRKTAGIAGRVTLLKGKSVERRFLDISKAQQVVKCGECGEGYTSKVKFCEVCGNNMESADWASASQMLQSASAEVITLKLSVLSDKDHDEFTDEDIANAVISALAAEIRKRDTVQLTDGSDLARLSQELNKALHQKFNGILSEFSIIDVRTAGQDWFFKTEAAIAEELRVIDAEQRGLAVDERALDFKEAAFALAMRAASQRGSQRRSELQQRAQTVEIELDEHSLETRTELRREGIDHDAEGERLEREKERLKREREFQRDVVKENRVDQVEQTKQARGDELDQALHEIKLEKTVAQHDIELSDLTGEAQSRAKRRDISDKSYESEEQIRLKAAERSQLGNIEEDLQDRQNQRQVDKLKAMAEMEANMAKQDHDFELTKVEGMKTMDAAQILAMQAAQLVKAGGNEAAADIVKSIAQSQADAAGNAIKGDLYRQLLQAKDDAAKLALDAQKTALDALLKSNEGIAKIAGAASSNAVEGYKEAAKVAQTTNEKSMDSMSKVATAAAGKKPTKEESDAVTTTDCKNQDCDFVFEGKVKKFCPKCGANQL